MKQFKHLILALIWMTASWPCVHAASAEHHAHHAAQDELLLCNGCDHACQCHDCEHVPCADQLANKVPLTASDFSALLPSTTVSLSKIPFGAPREPIITAPPLRPSETLQQILTVQLLI